MGKPGHPLLELRDFSPQAAAQLREYSVTTAEEFLGLARTAPQQLISLLHLDRAGLQRLENAAAQVVSPQEQAEFAAAERRSSKEFGLGHDAPALGHDTF